MTATQIALALGAVSVLLQLVRTWLHILDRRERLHLRDEGGFVRVEPRGTRR
jgi:hypothetical protein